MSEEMFTAETNVFSSFLRKRQRVLKDKMFNETVLYLSETYLKNKRIRIEVIFSLFLISFII